MTRLLIVGGGLTGLSAALEAERRGLDWTLFEASDRVGGRVATDLIDGFAIDRGFQVLLTSYPSLAEHLEPLSLGRFEPGALVRLEGPSGKVRWARAIDPWRRPGDVWSLSWRHVLPPADALRLARLRSGIRHEDAGADGLETRRYLENRGFSSTAMTRFFTPFFGGVLLDRELSAPAAFMRRLFDYFARGDAAIPMGGMQALPARLMSRLSSARVRTSAPVESVSRGGLIVHGQRHEGRVLLCVEPEAARRLVGEKAPQSGGWHSTTTFYYEPDTLPRELSRPLLVLSPGPTSQAIHHLAPLSVVAPSLAPAGRHLVSVSHDGVADASLEPAVATELARWFPKTRWRLVAVTPVPHALPRWTEASRPFEKLADELWLAGDGIADRSIEGALSSGREAVTALCGLYAAR